MGIQEDWVSEREEFIEVRLVRGFGGESGRERSCQKDVRQTVEPDDIVRQNHECINDI